MATAVEQRSQAHLGGMGYDPMRYTTPQFTNPWHGHPNGTMYHPQASQPTLTPTSATQDQRASPLAAQYAPSHTQPAAMTQDIMQQQRQFDNPYVSAAPAPSTYLPTSAPRFSPEPYQSLQYGYEQDRRQPYQLKTPAVSVTRDGFSDVLDASRGMMAMSQDITPRNIYGTRGTSQESYGFPSAHSTTSSVSSASGYPYHYGSSYQGSVDGSSVTDYSSASEDMSSNRTLPAPTTGPYLPEPQSMMTQFNSKLSPSAQKKHKCKICDKRFTRPSSLQTHMYSHTGEKPFACDFEGCGRHFSVVSNLRRHKKCHKSSDSASVDDE